MTRTPSHEHGSAQPGVDQLAAAQRVEHGGLFLLQRRVMDTVTVTVGGEIDLATAPRLAEQLDHGLAHAGAEPLVVDLSEVSFLAAAGLTVLLRAQQRAHANGAALRVVARTRPVLRPLRITGVDQLVPLCGTFAEALESKAPR